MHKRHQKGDLLFVHLFWRRWKVQETQAKKTYPRPSSSVVQQCGWASCETRCEVATHLVCDSLFLGTCITSLHLGSRNSSEKLRSALVSLGFVSSESLVEFWWKGALVETARHVKRFFRSQRFSLYIILHPQSKAA